MRYCLVILFSLLSSWAFAQERWAIVVGISEYPTSSGWCNINGANDINIIVPMLQRNGFVPTHITTLANDQATKGNIKNAIIALSNKVKDKDKKVSGVGYAFPLYPRSATWSFLILN